MGVDCAGTVAKVGPGVSGVAIGERVKRFPFSALRPYSLRKSYSEPKDLLKSATWIWLTKIPTTTGTTPQAATAS